MFGLRGVTAIVVLAALGAQFVALPPSVLLLHVIFLFVEDKVWGGSRKESRERSKGDERWRRMEMNVASTRLT